MSLTPGKHGGQRDEVGVEGVGHQARQRGLADARRAPQDHRVRLARGERDRQRLARREEVALTDDFARSVRGRRRSASGVAGLAAVNRSASVFMSCGHRASRYRWRTACRQVSTAVFTAAYLGLIRS